ncbi:MAG: PTS sugar transporter subunit IIB [Sporolactobacillus sp.]|jgi:PTS system cellobiose-specific IIB component|nr:PTS sugar transporter subunit IIB [Sporolactobacillus sp.]
MRKIVLLCQNGMSTSILARKMEKAAAEMGYSCVITAFPVLDIDNIIEQPDLILLGPQIRFQKKKLQSLYPQYKFAVIDMVAYGTMNGKKIIEQSKKVLGD